MMAPETAKAEELIRASGAKVGDRIHIVRKADRAEYIGLLMPHHSFSAPEIITLKLENGYNIGIEVSEETLLTVLERGQERKRILCMTENDETKPTLAIISTGGTIASFVEYRTGAVHPALSADDLVASLPEVAEAKAKACNLRARVLFSLLSEDLKTEHWQKLAQAIAEEFNAGAKGVIISHGTDTMGYTAALLSFMLSNLPGPVILVGSQRSSDRPSSDAGLNMLSAVKLALEGDLGEVVVVMHGEPSDSYCSILRGTKVRKMHSSRRDAFQPINVTELGRIEGGRVHYLTPHRNPSEGPVEVKLALEAKVALVHFYPGFTVELFEYLADRNVGLVIAGTGLGHVSSQLYKAITTYIADGGYVVMTTQCLFGRVNMNVYSTGRKLLQAGVISGGDMLPETAYVKLMWVLGQTQDPEEVSAMLTTDIAGEFTALLNHNAHILCPN